MTFKKLNNTPDPESIMLFEAWKESDDYAIQAWFSGQASKLANIFKDEALKGFTFGDFVWSPSDSYNIYSGHVEFEEETVEYKLDIIVDISTLKEGEITSIILILTGYSIDNSESIGKLRKDLESTDITTDIIINLITELKESYAPKPNE